MGLHCICEQCSYAKLFCGKYDRELNLHFEEETRLICLFDGAAVNVYKLFISI